MQDRPNTETVLNFLETFKRELPINLKDITLVTDNHSAHKSHLTKKWLFENNTSFYFLPPYSSVLSPVERVWSVFKSKWAK